MPGAVEIWSVDLDAAATDLLVLEADSGLLTAADRAAADGIADQAAAHRRLAAIVALRLVLCGIAGRVSATRGFAREAQGKPYLPDGACHFNVAHSGSRVLIALSTHAVGIDIELPRDVHMEARRRLLIESAAIAVGHGKQLPGRTVQQRFLQAWTRLEALAKADGCGIGRVLTEIGAVGRRRDVGGDELPELLKVLSARYVTHDLRLTDDVVGAVAGACEVKGDPVDRKLPSDPAALRSLMETPRRIGDASLSAKI